MLETSSASTPIMHIMSTHMAGDPLIRLGQSQHVIVREAPVNRDDAQPLACGLGDEHAVERVAVVARPSAGCQAVLDVTGSAWKPSCSRCWARRSGTARLPSAALIAISHAVTSGAVTVEAGSTIA